MRVASKPWTIDAAGGMAVGAYADMSTGIETMIGVTVIATGGGTGGIAIATENSGSLAETQRATVA
jgi:hypothetical protein